jgi:hypothetical protein
MRRKKTNKTMEKLSVIDQTPHMHNMMVTVEVLGLLCFDGDPEIDGAEYYAPDDFDMNSYCAANQIEMPLCDELGNPIIIAGSRFVTTLVQAQAMAAARIVRIIK